MRDTIRKHIQTCDTCQHLKKQKKKYRHLPPKEAESNPWERLCVDLVGPYTIKRKGNKDLELQACTMIDPATGWFEMTPYNNKQSFTIASLVEQN